MFSEESEPDGIVDNEPAGAISTRDCGGVAKNDGVSTGAAMRGAYAATRWLVGVTGRSTLTRFVSEMSAPRGLMMAGELGFGTGGYGYP